MHNYLTSGSLWAPHSLFSSPTSNRPSSPCHPGRLQDPLVVACSSSRALLTAECLSCHEHHYKVTFIPAKVTFILRWQLFLLRWHLFLLRWHHCWGNTPVCMKVLLLYEALALRWFLRWHPVGVHRWHFKVTSRKFREEPGSLLTICLKKCA